jgi:hypothetical protein
MEATRCSETSVYNKPTRRHIPEDGILRSRRRENLKSYITKISPPVFCLHLICCLFNDAVRNGITEENHEKTSLTTVPCPSRDSNRVLPYVTASAQRLSTRNMADGEPGVTYPTAGVDSGLTVQLLYWLRARKAACTLEPARDSCLAGTDLENTRTLPHPSWPPSHLAMCSSS